ncbi:HAD family hydrolase [Sphingomonas sp. CFBP 8760]|uniref:HAD family hydrolase n=1 Tax=Sphingomonas sp. CFBP 8760 TaxID=2775282 RepID=UPI0018FE205B|nr:HAD family hydrolase [Sphingomonas sp. CFBP 8760]
MVFVMHLALGGCLKAPPVRYGLTADTGGHIAYIMEAALAQAEMPEIERISIVTRRFDDPALGADHDRATERMGDRITIDRIGTANTAYLEKEALLADRPAFLAALHAHLAALPRRPDAIHAHFADAAEIAMAVRERWGIPFVYTPHALGIDKRAQQVGGDGLNVRIAEERAAIAAADAIIVSTRDEADRQIAAYGVADAASRLHCLSPGAPSRPAGRGTGVIDTVDAMLADPGKPIVLAIARPVRKKNLAALVRAYAATPTLAERANLVILAGQQDDGRCSIEEREVIAELRRLCADPALQGRVALPARHDEADVEALYRRAAAGGVFVNPALHEPFGLTLIEAAAAGVPVVATRHGGPSEIVATVGHGLLVDPRDEAAIGAACLAIISDAALHRRLAGAARAHAGHYSWANYAAGSVAVYAGLRRMPILLASDIDNTLTGCTAGAAAFAAWNRTRELGYVVATGRSFAAARKVLAQWRLPEPDAFIVDVGTRIMLPTPGGGWHEWDNYAVALDRDWDRPAVVAALAPLALTAQPHETEGPHKLSFFGDATDAATIRAALTAAGLATRVVFSHGELIDVLAPHAGKAAAIAAYAARRGLSLADCIAAGDSGNDIDMLEACGHAIVVGNAGAELDGLTPRAGLNRVRGRHAAGVMEGLAAIGIVPPVREMMAA